MLVLFGGLLFGFRHVLRQQNIEGVLDAFLLVMVLAILAYGLTELLFLAATKQPKEWPKFIAAYVVSGVGFAVALLFIAPAFFKGTRIETLLAQINVPLLWVAWFQVLTVLDILCTPTTKKETLKEGHCGVVMKKDRIERVVFGSTAEIALKDEKVVPARFTAYS